MLHCSFHLRRSLLPAGLVALVTLLLAGCVALPVSPAAIPGATPAPTTARAAAPSIVATAATPSALAMQPVAIPVTSTFPASTRQPACNPAPVAQPKMPAKVPGYLEEDPDTGLHMTGHPTEVDLAAYRLRVTGKVDRRLALTYDELRCMPRVECPGCDLICPGVFRDKASWAGASLDYVLDLAGIQPGASAIELISADGYSTDVSLGDARGEHNFLAYEQTGKPLSVLQGFPVRAVFPGQAGGKWIKWLVEIAVK